MTRATKRKTTKKAQKAPKASAKRKIQKNSSLSSVTAEFSDAVAQTIKLTPQNRKKDACKITTKIKSQKKRSVAKRQRSLTLHDVQTNGINAK